MAFTVAPVKSWERLPSQSTFASHCCTSPAMLNGVEVTEPNPVADATNVYPSPGSSIERSSNVAMPDDVSTGDVPERTPPPGLFPMSIEMETGEPPVIRLFAPSYVPTCNGGPSGSEATDEIVASGPVSAGWRPVMNASEQAPVTAVVRWLGGVISRNDDPVKAAPVFAAADQTLPVLGEQAAVAVTLTVNQCRKARLRLRSFTVLPTMVAVPREVRAPVIE